MAATNGTEVKSGEGGLKVGDLKKEGKTLEEFLNLPSVVRVTHNRSHSGGPINYTVQSCLCL